MHSSDTYLTKLLVTLGKYEETDFLYLRAIEIWEAKLGPEYLHIVE